MKKGAIFIGRFNPPTSGHFNLLDKLKAFIIKTRRTHSIDPTVFIVVVDGELSSKDANKNPLSAAERIALMSKHPSCAGCKFVIAKTAIDGFNKMRDAGYEPILIAGGDDRSSGYIKILQDYDPSIERIEFSIKRNKIDPSQSANILDHISSDDYNIFSSTLARHAALKGDINAFRTITGLDDPIASQVMEKIKSRIENA